MDQFYARGATMHDAGGSPEARQRADGDGLSHRAKTAVETSTGASVGSVPVRVARGNRRGVDG